MKNDVIYINNKLFKTNDTPTEAENFGNKLEIMLINTYKSLVDLFKDIDPNDIQFCKNLANKIISALDGNIWVYDDILSKSLGVKQNLIEIYDIYIIDKNDAEPIQLSLKYNFDKVNDITRNQSILAIEKCLDNLFRESKLKLYSVKTQENKWYNVYDVLLLAAFNTILADISTFIITELLNDSAFKTNHLPVQFYLVMYMQYLSNRILEGIEFNDDSETSCTLQAYTRMETLSTSELRGGLYRLELLPKQTV